MIKINKNPSALIATEAGKESGYGHLNRSCAYYDAFHSLGVKTTIIVNGDPSVMKFVQGKSSEIFDWIHDEERYVKNVKEHDIVIIDSYLCEVQKYESVIRCNKLLVSLDDYQRLSYPGGIVVNGAIGAEKINYKIRGLVKLFVGVKYAPLRKDFWNVPENKISKDLKNILVTFGGSDANNYIIKTLEILSQIAPEINRKVVFGGDKNKLRAMQKFESSNTVLLHNITAKHMIKTMSESDLAISAAGQTLYELARIGVPTIAMKIATNQTGNINGMSEAGFVTRMESFDELPGLVDEYIDYDYRSKKSAIGRRLVDGQGSKRIVREILNELLSLKAT